MIDKARRLDKIYAEITNACNLRCSFCPSTVRRRESISPDRFALLLSRIKGAAKSLYFHVKGEPLLHPNLPKLIDLAGDAGYDVLITTNGSLLPNRLRDLAGRRALRRLNVSLHSLEESGNGAEAALEDILAAVSVLRESDPERKSLSTISLRLWNRDDREQTDRLIAGIERHFSLSAGALVQSLSEQGGRGVVVRSGISVHPADRFDWPDPAAAAADPARGGESGGYCSGNSLGACRGYCRALHDQAGILVDGTVVPCCLDGDGVIDLGNVYETPWEEIMNGSRARALRDGFSRRRVVEPLCRSCGYRKRFE
jgi:hypothetical protein